MHWVGNTGVVLLTIRGNHPNIIIIDDFDDNKPEPINLTNLSAEDLEAYKRDPEAFIGWLDTVMAGGPMFHFDSIPDPLSMVLSARPAMDFYPERDNTGPIMQPKWHKNRSGGYGGGYYAQQEARKRKRLDKRAITKANRKRARQGRSR